MDYYTRKEKAVKLIEKLISMKVQDETIYYNVEKTYLFGKQFCKKQIDRIRRDLEGQKRLDDGQTNISEVEKRRI